MKYIKVKEIMIKKIKFLLEQNRYIKRVTLFIYSSTYGKYKYYKENRNFLMNAEKVLSKVDEVFNELNTNYWLDFGTLLGAYRNKDFIKHDLDLDFGAYLSEYSINTEAVFNKHGFKKIKEFLIDNGEYGREETYIYLGVSIDIFYYTRVNTQKAYYHDFRPIEGLSRDLTISKIGGLIPREITLSLYPEVGYISFLSNRHPIPEPVKQHLEDRYGKDFMIENPAWSTDKETNQNIKTLKTKIGVRYIYE